MLVFLIGKSYCVLNDSPFWDILSLHSFTILCIAVMLYISINVLSFTNFLLYFSVYSTHIINYLSTFFRRVKLLGMPCVTVSQWPILKLDFNPCSCTVLCEISKYCRTLSIYPGNYYRQAVYVHLDLNIHMFRFCRVSMLVKLHPRGTCHLMTQGDKSSYRVL